MSWKSLKFKDFLHRSKLPVDIADGESYKRVTIRIKHQGVSLRDFEIGKKIGTKKQFILKGGQFIMSKIDARQGAFGIAPDEVNGAIITGNFWAYDVDQNLVSIEWLNQYTNSAAFYDVCERASSGITHRKYLDEKAFLDHVIEVPDIKEQLVLVEQIGIKKKAVASVLEAADQQLAYLTQLRQALLREAMQGRLLPQAPTDEPAAVLLQKLQAQKAQLGKAGKRKPKDLFAEEAEVVEGPFEIPESWVWCRLGDLAFSSEGGSSFKCEDRAAIGKEWGILKMSAISSGRFEEQENKFYSKEAPKDISARIKAGDFIITRASGSAELVAKSVFVQDVVGNVLLNDKTIRYDFGGMSNVEFLNYCNNSSYARAYFRSVNSATSTTMKNVTRPQIDGLPIPLPPLAEQTRIVAKLEQLLGHCEALEQRIRESRRLAEQLLQTALREALAGPGVVEAAPQAQYATGDLFIGVTEKAR